MRILFISRKYPPSVGGMERMSYCLLRELGKKTETDSIVWGHSQMFLPIFLLKAILQAFININLIKRRYDAILLGDALLSPVGLFIKRFVRIPVICIAHGLDITFKNRLYQRILIPSVRKMDAVICVSDNTKKECMSRGVAPGKIRYIPNGAEPCPVELHPGSLRSELKSMGHSLQGDCRILLTVGRLVRRKGVAEFIEHAFGDLKRSNPGLIYLIAGKGREKKRIEGVICKEGFGGSIFLLGSVDQNLLCSLYASADIFIMPNIHVPGDVEGFGIVALEASSYGLPVVGTGIEGIRDAVRDGENGFLVPTGRYDIFTDRINYLLNNNEIRSAMRAKARAVAEKFSWNNIADRYIKTLQDVIGSR